MNDAHRHAQELARIARDPDPARRRARLVMELDGLTEAQDEARAEVERLQAARLRVLDALAALGLLDPPPATRPVDAPRTTQEKIDAFHASLAELPAPTGRAESERCPDALLPDGPTCPRCGGPRGVGGGSWVHFPRGGETL